MITRLLVGDCLKSLKRIPDNHIQCCITSPPYFGLRDYGVSGQIGLEPNPDTYIKSLVNVFNQIKRILKDDGVLWVNIGDSYAANRSYQVPSTKGGRKHGEAQGVNGRGQRASDYGLKPKDLIGIPWRLAFALQKDGWYLRQDIIWNKPNAMPESVKDRCVKSHEYIFLLSKKQKYFFDYGAIKEEGEKGKRSKRSVWSVNTKNCKLAHFAVYPIDLITPCILSSTKVGDVVLDPFAGSGSTGLASLRLKRNSILCELNPKYSRIIKQQIEGEGFKCKMLKLKEKNNDG